MENQKTVVQVDLVMTYPITEMRIILETPPIPQRNQTNSNEENVQHNLADPMATLAKNV